MWYNYIVQQNNSIQQYSELTQYLELKYLSNEYTPDMKYVECLHCESKLKCPLLKRIKDKNKARFYLGVEADRVNKEFNPS